MLRNPHHPNNVTIPREQYHSLKRSRAMLSALEAGGVDNRQAVLCYASLLAPKHVTIRAIHAPDLTRCKDGTYSAGVPAMATLCLFVMNLIAIF